MRHAFLIIAHNEFEILQILVNQLDSVECDIYVHFDKKVKTLPELTANKSRLYILPNRFDVRWGNVSQIKTELFLLAYANAKSTELGLNYDYYHIISGTHLLLTDLDGLNKYFKDRPSAIFTRYYTNDFEIDIKVRRRNLFTRTFASRNIFLSRVSQKGWTLSNRIQKALGIKRYEGESFVKASNWCSLSKEATEYLIDHKTLILKKYRMSFCADEFFAPSELTLSPLSGRISWRDDYLYTDFAKTSNPKVLTIGDYDEIIGSNCIWARKFSIFDLSLVNRIIDNH